MTSLLDIGSQCSHSACNELDFLPIICQCTKPFCRHHINPESHQCPALTARAPARIAQPFDKLHPCDVPNCSQPSLNAFSSGQDVTPTCLACKQSFCAVHRHPASHTCPAQTERPPPEKTTAARALLAKNFPVSTTKKPTSRRVPKAPTDPAKLAQFRKIELMKMRHQATPGDPRDGPQSVSLDQRLYTRILVDGQDVVLWFRKAMIAGKVLDCLAIHLKMKSSDQSPLQLSKVLGDDSSEVLLNDRPIGNQADDGDTLVVSFIHSSN